MSKIVVNYNVDFVGRKSFWIANLLFIGMFRYFFWIFPIPQVYGWTLIHLVHAIGSFFAFHWAKGADSVVGEAEQAHSHFYNKTWWEQVDNGEQLTPARKFLTIVPIVLFALAANETDWAQGPLIINSIALALIIIPKLPAMHKVRLFKINSD